MRKQSNSKKLLADCEASVKYYRDSLVEALKTEAQGKKHAALAAKHLEWAEEKLAAVNATQPAVWKLCRTSLFPPNNVKKFKALVARIGCELITGDDPEFGGRYKGKDLYGFTGTTLPTTFKWQSPEGFLVVLASHIPERTLVTLHQLTVQGTTWFDGQAFLVDSQGVLGKVGLHDLGQVYPKRHPDVPHDYYQLHDSMVWRRRSYS